MKKTLYKYLVNWYQACGKPLPKWLERACEADHDLAFERDLGEELTRSLKKRPNDATPFAGESMTARVMRQITEEDYLEEQSANSGFAWAGLLRSTGMVAAAFAVALVGYQFLKKTPGGESGLPSNETSQAIASSELSESVSDMSSEDLMKLGDNWKNPLDQEIEYVISDARGALDFLTTSFVPSSYLKKDDLPGDGRKA